jgi:hypothetical protein
MKKDESNILKSINAISDYFQRGHATIMMLIQRADFPAKKIDYVWMSSKDAIDAWAEKYFNLKSDIEKKNVEIKEKTTKKKK